MIFNMLISMIQLKKLYYNTKFDEIDKNILGHNYGKYITTEEFNKLTAYNFATRLPQAKLAAKADILKKKKKLITNLKIFLNKFFQIKQTFRD